MDGLKTTAGITFITSTIYNLNKLTRCDREEPSHFIHKVLLIAAFENLVLQQKIFKKCG